MVKYSVRSLNKDTSVKASGENLRVHFKNIVEVAQAVKYKSLTRAKAYLKNVLAHKEAIPINTHKLGRGRHAQVRFCSPPPLLPLPRGRGARPPPPSVDGICSPSLPPSPPPPPLPAANPPLPPTHACAPPPFRAKT
jgi:hypothetical protein